MQALLDNADDHAAAIADTKLEIRDFEVIAYNQFGGTVTPPALSALTAETPPDGKNFTMTLAAVTAPNAQTPTIATEITRVLILIPKHAVELTAVVPTQAIILMYHVMMPDTSAGAAVSTMKLADGRQWCP